MSDQQAQELADDRDLRQVALEFYAYRGNYPLGPNDEGVPAIVEDGGWRARAALAAARAPVPVERPDERTGPELSCPTCGYRCHWPICTKCGTPTPRGPWSIPARLPEQPDEAPA